MLKLTGLNWASSMLHRMSNLLEWYWKGYIMSKMIGHIRGEQERVQEGEHRQS
jgi:hypothetical protein